MYNPQQEKNFFDLTQNLLKQDSKKTDIEIIRDVIRFHEWKYYIQDNPIITDYDYDILFQKLKDIEEKYPESITPDSPTVRVSSDLTSDFPTVTHLSPMLSLENSYNDEDLKGFDKQGLSILGWVQ